MSSSNNRYKDNRGNTYTVQSPYKVRVDNPVKGTSYINQEQFNRRKNGN